MTYNPGQLYQIVPFVRTPPKAMILAGPADGNEAQTAVSLWPDLLVVGVEPYAPACEWQRSKKWPGPYLINAALSNVNGSDTLYFHYDEQTNGRASRLGHDFGAGGCQVQTVTLDTLAETYLSEISGGVLLWLDIEGAELRALQGGPLLFGSGRVDYVNVECMDRNEEQNREIDALLRSYGLELAGELNVQLGLVRDRFYRRKGL